MRGLSPDPRYAAAVDQRIEPGPGQESVWDYPRPPRVEAGAERATPQPGRFYGGWVTSRIVGPFKGEPGTSGW